MMSFRRLAVLVIPAGLVVATPALAHPKLVSSNPAAAASTGNVKTVTLTFSETLMPQLSGLEVVMTGMPGMEGHHPARKVNGVKVSPSADGKSLVATMIRPLPAGSYDVNWHAVGDDTHRVTGKVSFLVR